MSLSSKFMAVTAAVALMAVGAASADADTVTLHGTAEVVTAAGSPSGKAFQMESGPSSYGSVQYNYAADRTVKFENYHSMSLSYNVLSEEGYAGGSPRVGFGLNMDGDNSFDQTVGGDNYVFIYLDQLTGFTAGDWRNTGNLFASGVHFDLSNVGGAYSSDSAAAKALVGDYRIDHMVLAVDGGWKANQSFQFDNLVINSQTEDLYGLVVVPTPSAALAGLSLMGITALRRRRAN